MAPKVHQVPVLPMTEESVAGLGHIVDEFETADVTLVPWPAAGWRPVTEGLGGGIVEGAFGMTWQGDLLYGRNNGVERSYILGWSCEPETARPDRTVDRRDHILVREANYHPDGGQIFVSKNAAPFVLLLAKPGDDVRPEDFVALHSDGSRGLHIDPGTWHQAPFTLAAADSFDNKQGRVHACVECDFLEEFGLYLSVPWPAVS